MSEVKGYRLHWLGGSTEDIYGASISNAFALAGYSGGAVDALDYYEELGPIHLDKDQPEESEDAEACYAARSIPADSIQGRTIRIYRVSYDDIPKSVIVIKQPGDTPGEECYSLMEAKRYVDISDVELKAGDIIYVLQCNPLKIEVIE